MPCLDSLSILGWQDIDNCFCRNGQFAFATEQSKKEKSALPERSFVYGKAKPAACMQVSALAFRELEGLECRHAKSQCVDLIPPAPAFHDSPQGGRQGSQGSEAHANEDNNSNQ